MAGHLPAGDPMVMIKEKAKGIANQNNAEQGVPPAYPAAPPPPATPVAPQLTPQQQALVQLLTDLGKTKPDESEKIAADLMAVAQGPNKPSWPAINKLAKDLTRALAGKPLTGNPRSRMAVDLQTILNGGNLPAAQMNDVIANVTAILKKAGAEEKAAAAVGDDLRAIAAEIKQKPAKQGAKKTATRCRIAACKFPSPAYRPCLSMSLIRSPTRQL